MDHALALLADLRAAQNRGWVNQFLQEYRLNSSEGVALLSLAEAFLRVPDPETADLLIADKLGDADWKAHAGKSNSMLVNSATWGLMLGRAVVGEQGGTLRRLISARRRAVRPPGGGRGDEDDGRGLRDGPHHRRGDEADEEARASGLHRELRHARRGGADQGGCRALFRGLFRGDPRGGPRSQGGAFDLGEAQRAASALRSGAVRQMRARADRHARAARVRGVQPAASRSPSMPRRASGSR
jgi:hypothetical protein